MQTPGIVQEHALSLPLLNGQSLAELSASGPVLLVFLRHLGCIFCHELLASLGAAAAELEQAGFHLVFVHMGTDEQARKLLGLHGLEDALKVSDPQQRVYQAFGLGRARFFQIVNVRTVLQGLRAAIDKGYRAGKVIGDPWQLPGLFIVRQGRVIYSYRPTQISAVPALPDLLGNQDPAD